MIISIDVEKYLTNLVSKHNKNHQRWGQWWSASVVECLFVMHKALGLIANTTKTSR
jgi:hypothetical protein